MLEKNENNLDSMTYLSMVCLLLSHKEDLAQVLHVAGSEQIALAPLGWYYVISFTDVRFSSFKLNSRGTLILQNTLCCFNQLAVFLSILQVSCIFYHLLGVRPMV